MADRTDYFFRQRVTEAELDLAFELLEKADRNLAADIGVYGIVSGAEPAQHQPVADLSIDLVAPARAYDHLGQRIFFGTDQVVDCSVDHAGIPTEVSSASNERWLGVFLKFDRLLSDPRTDGNSQQVYFRRDESFRIVVRQSPEGLIGAAPKVPLVEDELLVCDVLRRAGQSQILDMDIDVSRRQAFIFAQGNAVEVISGAWSILQPAINTVQAALDEVDAELNDHFSAGARRHAAADIDYQPHGFVSANQLQGAVDELVDDLSATTSGTPGASHVGADQATGTPHALAAGNVDGHLSQLLGWLNDHVGAATAAHAASAISVLDNANQLNSANVESALVEILTAFSGDHFRGNQSEAGQHSVIRQPVLGSGKALIWDALGVGAMGNRLRVIADSDSVWFTLNAFWDNGQWNRDVPTYYCAGFRLSRYLAEFLHDDSLAPTFTNWTNIWRLPTSSATNSAFETYGSVREEGRLGFETSNTHTSTRTVGLGGSVTFRSRFPTTPSSITLTEMDSSSNFSGDPSVYLINRDGFAYYSYKSIGPEESTWWFGRYTATA